VLTSYAIGLAAIVLMVVLWVAVQSAWKRVFPDVSCDPDVLAGRSGCHGCDSTNGCGGAAAGRAGSTEEEIS